MFHLYKDCTTVRGKASQRNELGHPLSCICSLCHCWLCWLSLVEK